VKPSDILPSVEEKKMLGQRHFNSLNQ
jgi:hypothetical protein